MEKLTPENLRSLLLQLQVESAITVNSSQPLTDERLQKFMNLRLPNALQQIEAKRLRYSNLMKRLESKRQE